MQDGVWDLTTGDAYTEMRGIALTSATYDDSTDSYPLLTGGVDEGTKVRVVVDLHNFSLDTAATDVTASFAYQALDPNNQLRPVGDPVVFATTQPLTLTPRSVRQIAEVWDTSGLAGTSGTPYRFVITLDTHGQEEIHGDDPDSGGNNRGTWPWSGSGFYVFTSGTLQRAALDGATRIAAPAVELELIEPARQTPGISHMARIDIGMTADDPTLRHLILAQPPRAADGIWHAVATRTLWGLPEGHTALEIPIRAEDLTDRPLRVWLSPGGQTVGPPRPTVSAPATPSWFVGARQTLSD